MNSIDNEHNAGIVPTNNGQGSSSEQGQVNIITPNALESANNQEGLNVVQPQSTADVMPKVEPIPAVSVTPDVNNSGVNSNSGIVNVTPQSSVVTPIPNIVSGVSNGTNTQDVNNDSMISVMSGNIIPESKDSNSNIQSNVSQGQQELKVEGSNPFDIGIGGNNINNMSMNQNNVTPTPIVPNNINNGSNKSEPIAITPGNVNKEPDINISASSVNSSDDNIVSVGRYLLHIILFCIPVIGFIMLIVKALDKKDKNISNFAKAQLILTVIYVAIVVIVTIIASFSVMNTISKTRDAYNNTSMNYDY